ncbi:glycoside hydrolase family protein [Flavobacterium limnosediminis JC2902]|uniref:Glycoside hydrolase family protein n=1 Tax=Flavobacterium limnosediminis JC2902 TaxID=1341181 RepID=V6SGV3_9FLAO|nr:glycoside hydrolase family protein [Flavobacterium limnosediminis JC2902]
MREMNIWIKYAQEITVVAPLQPVTDDAIYLSYEHDQLSFKPIRSFSFTSFKNTVTAFVNFPRILWVLFLAMRKADHIHLRCPGNVGLLGCLVQVLFPNTPKTAKYAGNWDPNAKQPLSYRLQKWILSNTFLTRNMKVLVYGEWEGSSENIKSFFTASYSNQEITNYKLGITDSKLGIPNYESQNSNYENQNSGLRDVDSIRFLFVGTLSEGKRPLYAVQLVEGLMDLGYPVCLDLYGEGKLRSVLEAYMKEKGLGNRIVLQGNQTSETIKRAYQESHFLVLPSKSEGWPKVVAEAMFWGCVPVATPVSCVSYMMDNGSRGIVLKMDEDVDVEQLVTCIEDADNYSQKAKKALHWSRQYTLDYFEEEIEKLVRSEEGK